MTDVQQWPVILRRYNKKKVLSSFAVKRWYLKYILKTCVYLAMAYLLVVRACFFAICTVKGPHSCSSICLTKAGRVHQECPCRTDGNLVLLLNSKDKRCWVKALSDEYKHVHFIFFQPSWTSLVIDILLWSSSHCFCLFLSSFGYKPASRRNLLSSRAAS